MGSNELGQDYKLANGRANIKQHIKFSHHRTHPAILANLPLPNGRHELDGQVGASDLSSATHALAGRADISGATAASLGRTDWSLVSRATHIECHRALVEGIPKCLLAP